MKKIFSTIISSPLKGRLCGLLFALLATTNLWAYDFQFGDLYYRITSSSASYTVEVTYLEYYSSENYSGLTTATIPDTVTYNGTTYSVTSIGYSAFRGCSSLTSITIPEGVTSIGDGAFRDCSSLSSITIPNSVTSIEDYAFSGCSSLTSITIPNGVTSIGERSFYDCSSLATINIPNSVTSIGDQAFYGCSSLTSIIIPEGVTSIGDYAFSGCSSLTSITIGNSVTSIGQWAFRGCSSLTSITIPNSVTSIGYGAFYGCSSLTTVTIPESVTSIGNSAFYGCSSLTSIIIPEGVTSIEESAFRRCSSLTSVTIPESVTSIGYSAFYGCSSLTSVTIPESVTSIGYYAFRDCSSLTSITIPEGVTSIGDAAFSGCSSLTSVTIPNSVTSIGDYAFRECSSLTTVTIPESVTSIGDYAFYGCSSLTSIIIPNSVTSIGDDAFAETPWYNNISDGVIYLGKVLYKYKGTMPANTSITIEDGTVSISSYAFDGCSSLTSVTIPNSVTSIGDYAFYGCSSLTSVTIPNSVTSIGSFAFHGCSSLTSITIPESVTSIEFVTFGDCSSLTSITIPNSVTIIRTAAFSGCSSLTSITIPNSVTSIGNQAFSSCTSLTSITIPNSVTSIGEEAFYRCTSLTSVTIGNSVTSIGEEAFYRCTSLTSVTIGNSVTSIGDYAFGRCSSLTSITVGNSVTSIGNSAFSGCSSLSSITIPNSVTSIGNSAFYGCSSLTSIIIPEGVTSIEESAFEDCSSLTSVTIPNSVTSIGSSAFSGCYKLISIRCEATTPPTIEAYTFYGVSKSIPVYVPAGCAEVYNAAYGWNEFINIVVYTIQVYTSNSQMGTAKVDYNNYFSSQISATANHGYHFVQWSDGNTDNPRTLVLTQDTILTAEFAQSFSGQCGDSLYWELVDTTLHITGSGAMYDYTPNAAPWTLIRNSIKSITVAEGVTKIGNNAFDGCTALESVVWNAKNCADASSLETAPFNNIGSQIKSFTFGNAVEHIPAYICFGMEKLNAVNIPNATTSIGENAFAGCNKLYDVYCYAMEPPTAYESSFANYNAFLHVPCDNQRVYLLDILFGNFKYVECIEAETTPTDTVVVTPSFNDAEFIWPSNSSADSYTLAINKDGEVFCTLTFNANGQLTGIAFAPSRNGQHNAPAAAQTANGFAFTVTGLDEGANYTYDLLIQDRSGNTLQSYSGEFRTQSTNDRTVTVEYDAAQGQVTGAGTYLVGDTVTLTATPNDGYRFVRWSNEVEDNPYTFVISDNVTLSAEFEEVITTSVENTSPSQQSDTHKLLRNGQLLILRDGKTYNIMGAEVK